MADHEAVGGAGETAVCEWPGFVSESFTVKSAGDGEHLAHAGPAARTFITNDDDVTGVDFAGHDRGHCILLTFEDARRSFHAQVFDSGNLYNCAIRREIAFQNPQR